MKFKSLLLTLAVSAGARAETKPNVVFILADDLGWNDVSLYGNKFYETPNIDVLDQADVLDNTIIIFTSDNGPYFIPNKEHMPAEFHEVPVTNAQPLRAGKGTTCEAGTRVPLVVVWPGKVKPASESSALIQSAGFFPTFADMLGWKLPSELKFDGVSQRPVFEQNTSVRTELFCHFPHSQARCEYERMPAATPVSPSSYVRSGDWKLIHLYCDNADQSDRYELYGLATGPMAKTWTAYYDYYLDGKAVIAPAGNDEEEGAPAKPKGKKARAAKQKAEENE